MPDMVRSASGIGIVRTDEASLQAVKSVNMMRQPVLVRLTGVRMVI